MRVLGGELAGCGPDLLVRGVQGHLDGVAPGAAVVDVGGDGVGPVQGALGAGDVGDDELVVVPEAADPPLHVGGLLVGVEHEHVLGTGELAQLVGNQLAALQLAGLQQVLAELVLLGFGRGEAVLAGELVVVDDELAGLPDGAGDGVLDDGHEVLLGAQRARWPGPATPLMCAEGLPGQAPGGGRL